MGKVKVTQEQADKIKKLIETGQRDKDIIRLIDGDFDVHFNSYYRELGKMNGKTLLKALTIGYEVEPEFKVGDWVVHKNGNPFNTYLKPLAVKITSVKKDKIYYAEDCNVTRSERIRHATPEEIAEEKDRRWWRKHGREHLQFIKNDLVSYRDTSWGGLCTVSSNEYSKDAFGNRLVSLWNHRLEKFISINADNLQIVCFADDRKDVDNG